MNLFEHNSRKESLSSSPLSSRMRPKNLDEFIGQEHILGKGKALYNLLANKTIPSMIFWGTPGTGKTTLAKIIAEESGMNFRALSAVSSGLSDIRKISDEVIFQRTTSSKKTILFLDEIHRFSKSQQDSLLPLIEEGILILIGATTEHPGFSIINPLISRVKIFKFNPHDEKSINDILNRIIKNKDKLLKYSDIVIEEDVLKILSKGCGGDARKAIDTLELAVLSSKIINNQKLISKSSIKDLLENNFIYDKQSDNHYSHISAFIKSVRGSDPNAAIYYLARMLKNGEDPLFIARRLIISASEDIGLADPNAMLLANAAFDSVNKIGMPEGRIPLANATIYLCLAEKSNSSYMAINSAFNEVEANPISDIPIHLMNADTDLDKNLGIGEGYTYDHDSKDGFIRKNNFPEKIQNTNFYKPNERGTEKKLKERFEKLWLSE
jgi:putative ATPase